MTATESLLQCGSPAGERLTLSRRGAQVLSWHAAAGQPLLYLSPLEPAAGGARRGGIPVCFPQFSGRGPLPKHGFARSSDWTQDAAGPAGTLRLRLQDSAASRALWPHRFALVLQASLAPGTLAVTLDVRNEDDHPWAFTGALHTYLHVGEVAHAELHGLAGLTYEDALDGCALRTASETVPDLSGPIDRVYRQAGDPLTLRTATHTLQITQAGFEDVVVWNPGAAGAQVLADLPDADHRRMLCVEAAQAARPRMLQPGETWRGSQTLRLVAP
jgi:glucose-6-phosphate 1-epimerase